MNEKEMFAVTAGDLWVDTATLEDQLDMLYRLYSAWFVSAGEPRTLPRPDFLLAELKGVRPVSPNPPGAKQKVYRLLGMTDLNGVPCFAPQDLDDPVIDAAYGAWVECHMPELFELCGLPTMDRAGELEPCTRHEGHTGDCVSVRHDTQTVVGRYPGGGRRRATRGEITCMTCGRSHTPLEPCRPNSEDGE